METKPRPRALAMIFCEAVINDLKTNTRSLICCFNKINAPQVPCAFPKFNIFFLVTGGIGKYSFRMECVSDQNQKIVELSGDVVFEKEENITELDFGINALNFPAYGNYNFILYLGDDILVSRYLEVGTFKEEKQDKG